MKSTLRVPGDIPLMAIGYKYKYRKILVFIATEGYESDEPGDPYLSLFPGIYYNFSARPIGCTYLLGNYLNAWEKR